MQLVTALAIVAGAAGPQEAEDADPNGSYVQINAGVALENFDLDEAESIAGVDIDVDDSFAVGARFGNRFSENAAAEVVFDYLDQFDFETGGADFAEADAWALSANFKLYPLPGTVEPYGQVGVGLLSAEIEDTLGAGVSEDEEDFAFRFGGGLDVQLSESLFLNLDALYVLPTDELDEFEYFTLTGGIGVYLQR